MTEQKQASEQKQNYETGLTKISNTFFPMIESQLIGNGLKMDDYSKQCVMSAISAINAVLDSKGISINDPQLDKNNLTQNLLTVASLKLNPAANPREVYFQMRNVKKKVKDPETKRDVDVWTKQIEMGIEGDGNDAILANFGRGVQEVHQYWQVRAEDRFVYPSYRGIEMQPPEWTPTGKGEIVRIVYPISKTSGQTEYYIAEREDVTRNLIAHINNNLMNETFGIAESKFKATSDQKKKIDAKKREILKKVEDQGMKALDDESVQDYISPAWKDPQSRESMIIRKMRNNVVKKIPKDFGNAFVEMTYDEAEDDSYSKIRREVNEKANQEVLDIEPEEPKKPVTETPDYIDAEFVETPAPEPVQADQETGEIIKEPVPAGSATPEEEGPGF